MIRTTSKASVRAKLFVFRNEKTSADLPRLLSILYQLGGLDVDRSVSFAWFVRDPECFRRATNQTRDSISMRNSGPRKLRQTHVPVSAFLSPVLNPLCK